MILKASKRFFSVLILLWIALPVEGQFHFGAGFSAKNKSYVQKLESFAKRPALSGASWSVMIQDLKSGQTLVRANERTNLIPASNLKLITALNGLKNLGPGYTFKTKIWTTGTLSNGVLNGNLLIEGSGDPTIYSPDREKYKENFFRTLVALLKSSGIKEITGAILEKPSQNPFAGLRSDWSWSDVGNYYGAGIFPLNINENQYSMYLQAPAEGSAARLKKRDSIGNPEVGEVDVVTTSPGSPDLAYIYWVPGRQKVSIKGSLPQQKDSQKIKGAVMDPPAEFLRITGSELEKAGIAVKGEAISSASLQEVGVIESPVLSQIVKEINLNSNNLMTESVGYALCQKDSKPDEWGWTHLAKFATTFSCPPGYYFSDACGLSLSNRISAEGFCRALRWAANQTFFPVFYESLPTSGISGTMKNFCKSPAAKGKIHAKSGTLNRVLCYSGYAETNDGLVVFSIMINSYNGNFFAMKHELETLMEGLPGIVK